MKPKDAVTVNSLLAHSQFVRGLARVLVHDAATADDAVQQTWIEACERPPRNHASPRGWLATVTQQAVRKIRRGEARRRTHERAAARREHLPSTAQIVEREETRRRLVDAVLALPERYRGAIVLRYLDQLPPRDVATTLGVPVETARTRIRRGLELLRHTLDRDWHGDSRGWAISLIPWALPSATPTVSKSVAVIALIGAAAAGVAGGVFAVRSYYGSSPAALAKLASTPAAGTPASLKRGQRPAEPVRRLAATPRKIQAVGQLRLQAKLEHAVVDSRAPVVLTATFTNTGTGPVHFFVPEHVPLVPFPSWKLVATDGRTFAPAARPFQSEWARGIQGTIRKLDPGEVWSTTLRTTGFRRVDLPTKARTHSEAVRLPPGQYRVRCTYAKPTQDVPYGEASFRVRKQSVARLWTGEIQAPALALSITKTPIPTLELGGAARPIAGDPLELTLTVHNPTDTTLALADLSVALHFKPGGGVAAVPARVIEGATPPFSVSPGAKLRVHVDLTRLVFDSRSGHFGLYERIQAGTVRCSASWKRRGDGPELRSDGTSIRIRRRSAEPTPGLNLTLLRMGGTRVQLRLTNRSHSSIRVCKRLSWPREVRITLVDTAHQRNTHRSVTLFGGLRMDEAPMPAPAQIVDCVSWNGSAYERPGALTAQDFGELASHGMLTREFDLTKLVHGHIPPGEYEVRATWSSLSDGRHLGLEPARIAVLKTPPLIVSVD